MAGSIWTARASYAVLVLPPNDLNLTPPLLGRIGWFYPRGPDGRGRAAATFAEPEKLSALRRAGEIVGEKTLG